MTYYLVVVFVLYFSILLWLITGWVRASKISSSLIKREHYVSIVVAVRNEETNILTLLNAVKNIDYPKENFEVIIVDDHSEDDTLLVVKDFIEKNKIGRVLSLTEGEGKKNALALGISNAQGEIIATTDADCVVQVSWLKHINQMFQNDDLHLCVGAVKITKGKGIFSALQSLEFTSVVGTGAATLGWGIPTMCNGANISFRKKTFEKVNGYAENLNYVSGDDQFLMKKIHEGYSRSVCFMPFAGSVVATNPQNSLSSFLHQRIRWAGKWSAMSGASKLLAVFIFVVQLSWIPLLFSFPLNSVPILTLFIVKIFLEFIFLMKVSKFLSLRFHWLSFFLLQFIYAPYVIATAIVSQFNAFEWKGRSYRS